MNVCEAQPETVRSLAYPAQRVTLVKETHTSVPIDPAAAGTTVSATTATHAMDSMFRIPSPGFQSPPQEKAFFEVMAPDARNGRAHELGGTRRPGPRHK